MNLPAASTEPRIQDGAPQSVEIRFSSNPLLLAGICASAVDFVCGSHPGKPHEVAVVLRELLVNAVEHGNKHDLGKYVTCRVTRIGPHAAEIAVEDEGEGFDPTHVDLGYPASPAELSRNGLRIANALSCALSFEEGGRRVVCRLSWGPDGRLCTMAAQAASNGKTERGAL